MDFERAYPNGSKALFRGPWTQLARLENVPRLPTAEWDPDSISAVEILNGVRGFPVARWTFKNNNFDQFLGYAWHPYGDGKEYSIEIANRHNFNVRPYGEARYPGDKFMVHCSDLMGGWYLT